MAYSGVYVFGDSLVDAGNALKLAKFYGTLTFSDLPEGAPTSELGYFQGRFSNGYTFTDLISNKTIGLVTKPVTHPARNAAPCRGRRTAPVRGAGQIGCSFGGAARGGGSTLFGYFELSDATPFVRSADVVGCDRFAR